MESTTPLTNSPASNDLIDMVVLFAEHLVGETLAFYLNTAVHTSDGSLTLTQDVVKSIGELIKKGQDSHMKFKALTQSGMMKGVSQNVAVHPHTVNSDTEPVH